jgi:predicted acyltransferase
VSKKKKTSEAVATGEQAIIIHPPLTGDTRALEVESNGGPVTTIILNDTATVIQSEPEPRAVPVAEVAPQPRGERALGLDAFRGALLLAMTFAMTIPFGAFPTWMYHMQNPPPTGDYAAIAGLTWRDMMFPGFLFTMSAAIPITNSLRLAKGMPYPAIIITAVKRTGLLMVFAWIIGHVNPYWTEDYTRRGNLIAIAGFLLCWPIFTRKLASWNDQKYRMVRRIGWIAVAAALFAGPLLYGKQFSLERRDGIIASLAICSLLAAGYPHPPRDSPRHHRSRRGGQARFHYHRLGAGCVGHDAGVMAL